MGCESSVEGGVSLDDGGGFGSDSDGRIESERRIEVNGDEERGPGRGEVGRGVGGKRKEDDRGGGRGWERGCEVSVDEGSAVPSKGESRSAGSNMEKHSVGKERTNQGKKGECSTLWVLGDAVSLGVPRGL